MGISAGDQILGEFLLLTMESVRLADYSQEGAVPSVSNRIVDAIQVAVPPLDEQRRIADLLNHVDEAIEKGREAEAHLRHARESLLAEVFGRSGPARDRSGWSEVQLEDVSTLDPETIGKGDRSGELRYVDLAAVSALRGIDLRAVKVLEWEDAPSRARRRIRSGDVLVSTVRPYLRGFALVEDTLDGSVGSTGFCVLRADQSKVLPGFVWAVVQAPQFTDHLINHQTGSNYPAVRAADVGSYRFRLPPLEEQREISRLVSCIDQALSGSQAKTDALVDARSGLLAVLLSGEHEIPESYDRFLEEVA
jgi:type I restriction enzyme S subunit